MTGDQQNTGAVPSTEHVEIILNQHEDLTHMAKRQKLAILRQGDVLLQPIVTLPSSMTAAALDADKSATVAHGEVTGHRHRFEFQAAADGSSLSRIFMHPIAPDEITAIELAEPQALVHEEHSTHQVSAGIWRVSRPYEYSGAELLRRVED